MYECETDDLLHELWLYIEQIEMQRIIGYKFCYSKKFYSIDIKMCEQDGYGVFKINYNKYISKTTGIAF
jgi:hypothetical protein